jgi:predicted peroxiredoxin
MNDPGFVNHAADGLAILLWSADPSVPHRLATPFFHAAAAAAMEIPVEIYFTARSVELLVPGVAAALCASARHDKTILDAMREAVDHGAVLLACSDALAAHGVDAASLIPECRGRGGAVQFAARAADLRWRTLVY